MTNLTEQNEDIKQIKEDGLTYLTEQALAEIKKTVRSLESNNVEGLFIETGCALGGSAILIGLNKSKERPFFVYDVFGMIPPPSETDGADVKKRYEIIFSGKSSGINNQTYYGYLEDLKSTVINNFTKYGIDLSSNTIHLMEGLYQDTLIIDQKVAFAHIDCDWYESVMTCLVEIVPHLSKGGKIIIDDYYDWSGCRTATNEYFADKQQDFKLSTVAGKLHVERVGK